MGKAQGKAQAKGASSKPQPRQKSPPRGQGTEQDEGETDEMAIAQSLSTKLSSAHAQSLAWLANLHVHEFRMHAAVLVSRIAIQGYRKMGVLGTAGEGSVWTQLAVVAMQRGRLGEARGLLARAQRLKNQAGKQTGGASDGASLRLHPDLLPDLEARAQMSMCMVQYRKAKDHLQEALALSDDALAPRNSLRCGTLVLLAAYMREVGRYREAYKVLASAGRLLQSFTERSPLAYRVAIEQAALDIEVGFLDEARVALADIQGLDVIPARHPDAAMVVWQQAHMELLNYRFVAARQLLDQARALLAASGLGLDARHSQQRQARLQCACQHAASKMSRRPLLVKFLNTIVPLAWQQLDRQEALHPLRLRLSLLQGLLLVQEGSLTQAHAGLLDLVERYSQLNPDAAATDSHPLIGMCKTGLAQRAFALGHFKEAQQTFASALSNKEKGGWLAGHVCIGRDHHGMALCALAQGRYKEARDKLRDAKALLRAAARGAETASSLAVQLSLAHLALELGRVGPDNASSLCSLHATNVAELLKRVWFMHVFLEEEAVSRERMMKQAAAQCRVLTFRAGDVVAQPNEVHPFMLILVRGSLDVLRPPPEDAGGSPPELQGWERIAQLRAGDTFGERALLLASPIDVCLRAAPLRQDSPAPHACGPDDAASGGGERPAQDDGSEPREEDGGEDDGGEALVVPRGAFHILFGALPQVDLAFCSCPSLVLSVCVCVCVSVCVSASGSVYECVNVCAPTDPVPRGQLWPTGSVGARHRVSRR